MGHHREFVIMIGFVYVIMDEGGAFVYPQQKKNSGITHLFG